MPTKPESPGKYRYLKSCTDFGASDVEHLLAMLDSEAETEITLATLKRNCGSKSISDWAALHGYGRSKSRGLTMANDYAISYHRSLYRGERCYFIRWSAIEFIWVTERLSKLSYWATRYGHHPIPLAPPIPPGIGSIIPARGGIDQAELERLAAERDRLATAAEQNRTYVPSWAEPEKQR
ncbi:hypothetical protein LCGC14_1036360 [marine sediment metagenome]|uniref:Uncharacterized protein n=1 Tax=marine sediment metagenome TaxID=412755 RepID=A0A0F9MT39_9ZZZZ